jgi:prepilin-type N-terminal cleavage/methylation domain-containing protein
MIVKKGENNKGVTLIELMIVLVIAVILMGAVYSLFITQHQSYSVQDQVAGAQQDARAALNIMARDIRMAGSLVGGDGFNVNTFTFAVNPQNGTPAASSPDQITVVGAAEEFISGGNPVTVTAVSSTGVTLSANADPAIFDTDKKRYVAFEGANQVYQITGGISTSTLTLNGSPPAYIANVGARVFPVKAITYLLTTADGVLRRNDNTGNGAQPLAGDGVTTFVEDLQIAYQITGDTTSWYNTTPAANTNADIRMVRITLIVRTVVPDPKETSFFKPACEDRLADNSNPGCRRRIYTTVVKVRNLKS